MELLEGVGLESTFVETGGVRLHVMQAGPVGGEPVILLHGFPEFWYGWRHQIPTLAEAGYRVWAPDQRGYNLSDKPCDIGSYDLGTLAKDVLGLIQATGQEKVRLVGHDWGAAVAWWVATRYPDKLEKLVILNVPHPLVMGEMLRKSWAQLRRSWYIFFFQLPKLPEWALLANDCQGGLEMLRRSGRPGTFSPEDLERYKQAWQQPHAMRGMIHWYRAAARKMLWGSPRDIRIPVPTLVLWGVNDLALGEELIQPSLDLCTDARLVLFEDATHWVQHDEAERVKRYVLEFFAQGA
jgi:pimeloyl-ACP methyl ester carboxylesterase